MSLPIVFSRNLLILTASSLLSACISSEGITPKSVLPVTDKINVGATIQSAQQDANWPQAAWWKAYGDDQLNQLMQQAIKNNPTLAQAQARVRAATAISDQMNAINLPQITGTASVSRKRWPADYFYGPGALGGTTSWDNTSVLHLEYEPDFWGENTKQAEQALDKVQLEVAKARMAVLDLEVNLVRSYIMLSYHNAQYQLAQQIVHQYKDMLSITKTRLQAGLGTQIELNTAQTQLADSKMQLTKLQEAIELNQHEIAALLGKGPGMGEALRPTKLAVKPMIQLPKAMPADLIGRRPDVVASRWLVASQNKGIEVAKARFYPDINLTAALGYMAVNGSMLGLFSAPKLTYGVGPALSLPIFDAGQLRGKLRETDAQYDAAVAIYKSSIINALKQLSDSVSKLNAAHQLAQNTHDAVTAAQQASQVAEAAYKKGLVNYMAVAQAHIKLYQQQALEQRSVAFQLSAYGMVASALGGGLMSNADNPKKQQLQYQDNHS